MRFKGVKEQRTSLEFDVAVTVENNISGKGGGEIKVWGIGQLGATGGIENKNSTVSRVTFGVDISETTKLEDLEVKTKNNHTQTINKLVNSSR